MPGPVKMEKPVEEIAKELKGIAKEKWVGKWVRLVNDLLRVYGIEDPEIIGIHDPLNPEEVMKFVIERCHGLTEPECVRRIEQEFYEHGYTRERELTRKLIEEETKYYEEKADWVRRAEVLFGIPVPLPPDVSEKLVQIYRNPELDHEEVFSLVKSELVRMGWPEEEAEEIAREAMKAVDKALERERERIKAMVPWTHLLRYDTRHLQARMERRRRKAKDIITKFIEAVAKERRLVSWVELTQLGLFKVQRARSKTPEEAIKRLEKVYNAKRAIIGSPAVMFRFTDRQFFCKVREIPAMGTFVIEECEEPVILVKEKGGVVYYQYIPGSKET